MMEIAVYVLSALRLCSASNSAWLDNLSLSYPANPGSLRNIRQMVHTLQLQGRRTQIGSCCRALTLVSAAS
ncbi:hypothetical protein X979_5489 [Burkholderia pseudomallei MSHR7527]|nr:hypothetical protein X979_5489 [Burkholderia pseudomallei MSHR7527]